MSLSVSENNIVLNMNVVYLRTLLGTSNIVLVQHLSNTCFWSIMYKEKSSVFAPFGTGQTDLGYNLVLKHHSYEKVHNPGV